jgi:hypothetical protein
LHLELTNKVAIVTGSNRGIGTAVTWQLAGEGVDVAVAQASAEFPRRGPEPERVHVETFPDSSGHLQPMRFPSTIHAGFEFYRKCSRQRWLRAEKEWQGHMSLLVDGETTIG